nr:hypothetical protein BaRGS_028893 [Batillaria attramentaria]
MPRLDTVLIGGNDLSYTSLAPVFAIPTLQKLDIKCGGAFDQLRGLEVLSLGNNHITAVPSTAFNADTRHRLQTLDLAGNPFECGCDILWFQNWLKTNPSKFENFDHEGYRCANVNNKTVKEFYISDQACILSRMESTLTIVFSSLAILFFATFSLCFGYRWHCRLWLYEVCRGREGKRHHRSAIWPARRFRYDLFVAYAEEDVDWVLEELLPVLEGQWGLRLCIHQRDFIPGKHIIDNISDCVDESDRIMMVFSPHFARSEWCQFELKMCQTCVMDRDDVLVLVTLQETVSRDLTGAMLAVMRTTTYIEWDDSPSARASFWGRLRIALQDVLQNVVSLIES